MSVTIKDIARAAGVSHATVSRALHNNPAISEKTARHVHQVAEALGYFPSAVARGLKTNRSRALGVIISSIADPFFSEVLQGIEETIQEAGYNLFVAATHRREDLAQKTVQAMAERRVDGVIVLSASIQGEQWRFLSSTGMPFVVVNNQASEDYRYSISHDDETGSRQLTRHLIELGHRRIAYLGNRTAGRTTEDRCRGYRAELEAAGIPLNEAYIHACGSGQPDCGEAAVPYFLSLPEPPTAIVCFNDWVAVGVIHGLQNAGVRVPQDCSVAGFDNIAFSRYVTPALTTFDQPKYHLGVESARLMLDLLERGEEAPESHILVLKGELLVRASTAPPGNNHK